MRYNKRAQSQQAEEQEEAWLTPNIISHRKKKIDYLKEIIKIQ